MGQVSRPWRGPRAPGPGGSLGVAQSRKLSGDPPPRLASASAPERAGPFGSCSQLAFPEDILEGS